MSAIRISAAFVSILAVCATGGCATKGRAAPERDRVDEVRRGVMDAAGTPLRDVGLIRPDIPAPLQGLTYPYSQEHLINGCAQVSYELGQLDAVLGAERYQPGRDSGLASQAGDLAQREAMSMVEDAFDVIPYRSWVRRASGAKSAEKRVARAIQMGVTRRAFLRGYGAALGCPNAVPAPPPQPEGEAPPVEPGTPPPQARDERSPR